MYDSKDFPPRITRGEDGVYRWMYLMNPRRNKHLLIVIGQTILVMAVISVTGLFIAGAPSLGMSDWTMPMMILGMFLGMFLLIAAILYLMGDDPIPFAMDEEKVVTFRGKATGPHLFRRMRRVRFMPQHDAIRLAFGVTLYVPREDYGFVQAFILEHLPPDVRVR